MASNKLFEAAADILAGSKSSAPAMPAEKLAGEVVELGGPTPENYKPDDDSAKLDATKGAKSATAPGSKPSAASPDKQEMLGGGQKTMKEDIEALFADDSTISEEFKSKVSTIFEARVMDRVAQIEEETESRYAGMLEEAVESIKQDLTEKVDDYLSYVVEQWMEENQIAIESGLRSEMTEDFIAGLRNLFAENFIDVPAEKVDLVEELASKVEELESKLDEEIERGVSYAKALVESRKSELTREVCEGLTATQVEKIKSLAESVDFSTEEEYQEKLETIRENYFPSGVKKASESQLQEEVTDGSEKKVVSSDPFVNAVANAISKTKV
tara:strand:- start:313 stop:1296 length:984 start_codon:yes stop_codon:yes gene_type:complete